MHVNNRALHVRLPALRRTSVVTVGELGYDFHVPPIRTEFGILPTRSVTQILPQVHPIWFSYSQILTCSAIQDVKVASDWLCVDLLSLGDRAAERDGIQETSSVGAERADGCDHSDKINLASVSRSQGNWRSGIIGIIGNRSRGMPATPLSHKSNEKHAIPLGSWRSHKREAVI